MGSRNTVIENAYVSYFDVLGFRALSGTAAFTAKYESLIETIRGIEEKGLSVFLLSDSIIMISEDLEQVKDQARDFYTWSVLNDFWMRGGIGKGSVTRYEEVTEQDKIIFPFLGEGYLKAYMMQSALNMSGINIDDQFFEGEAEDFTREVDYVEYEEHLPKTGYEGRKRLLLPSESSVEQIITSMHFEEMLKSHVEDIDKYVNTFCFYVSFLLKRADAATIGNFQENVLRELELHGRRVLIPSKVMIIFIAVVEGLFNRFRAPGGERYLTPAQLESDISNIVNALKEQGHLSAFIDYLLDYDKKRHTSLYKDINSLRSDLRGFR
ncbi:MAG: hypothetical protein ABSC19_02740 [Syntrophorhabdales bacterium]